jgi:uncharacterized DUF497 family protein
MDDTQDEFEGFEWDAAKSDATFVERGLDFEAAARVFGGDYLERESTRPEHGERRYVVTGEVEGFAVTVVWTPRGRRRRIVSARPASRQERRLYREHRAAVERADQDI